MEAFGGAGKTTTIKLLGPPDFARIGYVSENQELPEWMTVRQWMDYWQPFYLLSNVGLTPRRL